MTEDEKFVRETWAHVTVMLHHGTSHGRIELPHAHARFVSVDPGYERAWSEAAEFTRKRLEEILRVEEEIVVTTNAALSATRDVHKVMSGECATLCRGLEGAFAVCSVRHGRVILRLQAALSELKKGMKQ